MELERQMFGRTSKEIAREREAREMERAGVNQYLIDRFRAAAAELDAMEAKKKATEEADRAARESQRKREAEEKRIADEEKRRREQMFRAARQAATATDPESQYRESLKQYVEWLKEKAISLDEFARLKEKAAEKLAKPIKIGTADAGVRGIQKGSAEAVELAWRLRQQREKTGTVNERQAQIDKELADREDAKQYFGAMIAADKARSDAEAAAIAESDKQVAAGTDALSALGIDRAGVDMLADSANEMWRQSAQAAGITSQARTADGPKTVEILADIRTALTNQETIEVTEVSSL
jgi:hypothetical protein